MRGFLMALTLMAAVACGGGGGGGPAAPAPTRMNVTLVDAPTAEYQQINLDIQRVEIAQAGSGWITLGQPNQVIDLLTLTGGVTATLASGAVLAPGRYTQMRLVLGTRNTVRLADGSLHDLKVPSGQQSGIKLAVNFTVAEGTTADIFIDFDAAHSIHLHGAGQSGQYLLRPVVQAYDRLLTGSVSGSLRTASGASLAGAFVIAQSLDASGNPVLQRQVQVKADGTFTLDLLPVGGTYFVAAQPALSGTGYAAVAAGPFAVTSATPTFTATLTTSALAVSGSVEGTVNPAAGTDQGDVVYLQRSLVVGGSPRTLIVRTTVPTVSGSAETFTFAQVDLGLQTVRGQRTTVNLDGSATVGFSLNTPSVNVLGALPVTVSLQF